MFSTLAPYSLNSPSFIVEHHVIDAFIEDDEIGGVFRAEITTLASLPQNITHEIKGQLYEALSDTQMAWDDYDAGQQRLKERMQIKNHTL